MTISCPLCRQALSKSDKMWRCELNHCFDIAKQGYTNLLPVQHKKSLSPGDDNDMVMARTRFLNAGYYQPLSDRLNQKIIEHTKQLHRASCNVIDAGCGEGYYTANLTKALNDDRIKNHIIGADISKHAILSAAKRTKSVNWFVANSNHIPVSDHNADVLLSLFSPLSSSEFYRCLKNDGLLVIASTGQQHLMELREIIYDAVKDTAFNPAADLEKHFTLDSTCTIEHRISLPDNNTIKDLLSMTPHFWRVSPQRKQALNGIESLVVTIDIQLNFFKVKETGDA
jgi:23S rRNA (guanine745-N1)-methyltransferase